MLAEGLTSLPNMIKQDFDDKTGRQSLVRLHQKVTTAAQTFPAKIAPLKDQYQF